MMDYKVIRPFKESTDIWQQQVELINTLKESYKDVSRQEINRITGLGTADLKAIWEEHPNPRLCSFIRLAYSCGYKVILVKE